MIFNLFLNFQFTRKLKKHPVQVTVTLHLTEYSVRNINTVANRSFARSGLTTVTTGLLAK